MENTMNLHLRSDMTAEKNGIGGRELVAFALLGALMFALKMVLAFMPNIEPVSLLLIAYTLTFGRKALWPLCVYIGLEFMMWGAGLWNINYLYIWLILYGLTRLFRNMNSALGWAVLSGGFGLLFGLLCAPVYWVTGGWGAAVSWWIAGIPLDLVHCVGNFTAALFLLKPCLVVLERLKKQFFR